MRDLAIMLFATAFMLLPCEAHGQAQLYSGPQPGEKITPFKVLRITTPQKVEEVQLAHDQKHKATFLTFVHRISEPALGLMITLEWYAHQQKELDSHYILLAEDPSETEAQVKRWWRRPFFAGSPMSISVDGPEGPGPYGLNRKVDMTIVIAKDNKVASNFSLLAPNNTDAPKVLEAVADALGTPTPSYEKIREELRAERTKRRAQRMRENPVFKLAPHEELGRLMVQMLFHEGASAAHAKEVADTMVKWAGGNKEQQAALAEYCRSVLKGDFEVNRYAREALKKLAGI